MRPPKKLFREVDKVRRRFLWAQEKELTGGQCKVGWKKVCTPTEYGGLGVHDLQKFSTALRLRWLWLAWQNEDRPWKGSELPCDAADRALFDRATTVTVGDGKLASFWHSSWLTSPCLATLFPDLFKRSRGKNKCVADALINGTWVRDLRQQANSDLAQNFLILWRAIRAANVILQPQTEDKIRWHLHSSGQYNASSAYDAQFNTLPTTDNKLLIWKTWAPGKTKFFFWLLLQNRLWCNDRLQRRGWENGYFCPMCMRNLETSIHLFWECPMSKEIWRRISDWPGCRRLALLAATNDSITSAQRVRSLLQQSRSNLKAKLKTMIFLVTWHIWTERNNRIFRHTTNQVNGVIAAIRCDMDSWRLAGAKCLETPLGDPG